MKKLLLTVGFTVISVAAFGQPVNFGLKLTPQEQLQGIPLASTPFSGDELPSSVDLSDRMPPVGNQGRQNSCVGWAVGYACKSYQEKIEEGNSYWNGNGLNTDAVFSPNYIYNQINNGTDGGSFFPDALNIVSQQGVVKWSDMPYNVSDYLTKPNEQQKAKAKKYRIDFWRRVNYADIKEVKAQLNAGYPVIIGAVVDRNFVDGGFNTRGQPYIWRARTGQELGGHAMLAVGYDDDLAAFKIINSWGTNWGNDGYFWIAYDFFPTAVREAYVMKDAINGPEVSPSPGPSPSPTTPPKPNPSPNPYPIPNPTNDLRATFQISNMQHNLQDMQLGMVMRFDGMVNLPPGIGRSVQVVIRFYLNDGMNGRGMPIGSLSPYFMMPDGSAACGTPKVNAFTGMQPWYAVMPYNYLNVLRGGYNWGGQYVPRTTYLVAEPILYIDDFAVQVGQLIPFYVNL